MIYTIGRQTLVLNEPETKKTKENKGTPNQIVGWRDVAETCRTLHAVCASMKLDKNNPLIVDGIARAGFWGAIFREVWPGCKLILNDEKENCIPSLKRNFPNDTILNKSIKEIKLRKCDIGYLDFDHFTLRILDQWKDVLIAWGNACEYLIIADGACFGFKFGNMKHYGITDEKEYYYLLNEAISKFSNKRITTVCRFVNASNILLEEKKVKQIKFVELSKDLITDRGGNQQTPLF